MSFYCKSHAFTGDGRCRKQCATCESEATPSEAMPSAPSDRRIQQFAYPGIDKRTSADADSRVKEAIAKANGKTAAEKLKSLWERQLREAQREKEIVEQEWGHCSQTCAKLQGRAELAALRAPLPEVEAHIYDAGDNDPELVVPADYARDLARQVRFYHNLAASNLKDAETAEEKERKLAAQLREAQSRVFRNATREGEANDRAELAEQQRDEALRDAERLNWLEEEAKRERDSIPSNFVPLFRRNSPITRAAIDAARSAESKEEGK